MAWIELHQTLPRHPKLIRLAAKLSITRAQAAGHLTFLWLWALDYAPTGDLSGLEPLEISAAADFCGDAGQFAAALRSVGWLDENGEIHDWRDYAGRLVEARESSKIRMREFREKQRSRDGVWDKNKTVKERSRNIPVTNHERNRNVLKTFSKRSELPYSTIPYHTEEIAPSGVLEPQNQAAEKASEPKTGIKSGSGNQNSPATPPLRGNRYRGKESEHKKGAETKPRQRNVAFDTLAGVCGIDLASITGVEGSRVGKALAGIVTTMPGTGQDEIAAEITRRADNYHKNMPPGTILTPTALEKHWGASNAVRSQPANALPPWRQAQILEDEIAHHPANREWVGCVEAAIVESDRADLKAKREKLSQMKKTT